MFWILVRYSYWSLFVSQSSVKDWTVGDNNCMFSKLKWFYFTLNTSDEREQKKLLQKTLMFFNSIFNTVHKCWIVAGVHVVTEGQWPGGHRVHRHAHLHPPACHTQDADICCWHTEVCHPVSIPGGTEGPLTGRQGELGISGSRCFINDSISPILLGPFSWF